MEFWVGKYVGAVYSTERLKKARSDLFPGGERSAPERSGWVSGASDYEPADSDRKVAQSPIATAVTADTNLVYFRLDGD